MSKKLLESIGTHLKKLRIEAGYKTQEKFAKALNVSKSTIGNYEMGRNLPSSKYWERMINLLKCNTLDELFEPIFQHNRNTNKINELIAKVKRIYKNEDARRELYHQIDIINRLYNLGIKYKRELGEDGRAKNIGTAE